MGLRPQDAKKTPAHVTRSANVAELQKSVPALMSGSRAIGILRSKGHPNKTRKPSSGLMLLRKLGVAVKRIYESFSIDEDYFADEE